MGEFISNIQNVVQNNQILTTVAGGSIIVWLVSNIRMFIRSFINGVTALISFTITNYYEDNRGQDYLLFKKQIAFNDIITKSKALWERTKNLDLSTRDKCFDYNENYINLDNTPDLIYGFSIRWFLGKLCVVSRHIKNDAQKIIVTTDIRVFFANKKKFMNKLTSAIEEKKRQLMEDQKTKDFTYVNTIDSTSKKYNRNLNSIFTNNNEHIELFNDIKNFIENKDIYSNLNYPWKYSALIYGNPGCGKSSTILAIASELKRDIEYVNMTSVSSGRLVDIMSRCRGDSIFVFEDIDAISTGTSSNRTEDDPNANNGPIPIGSDSGCICTSSISLADLLNITDGLLSSDGAICIFTTNHIEKLDPALLRAGRMNKLVEFTYLNSDTANKMINKYLNCTIDNLKDGIKPAELQEEILQIKLGRSNIETLKKKFTKNS